MRVRGRCGRGGTRIIGEDGEEKRLQDQGVLGEGQNYNLSLSLLPPSSSSLQHVHGFPLKK